MKISNAIEIKSRFSSSINLERDTVEDSLDGYIPTGRALDVIRRIANGISNPSLGRSISITGPHGGGKSSLAVFIDSLVSCQHRELPQYLVEQFQLDMRYLLDVERPFQPHNI